MRHRQKDIRSRAERDALPEGCVGRASAKIEVRNGQEQPRFTVTTMLACAGLLEGVVEVGTNDHFLWESGRKAERKLRDHDLAASAAFLLEKCADCPLGPQGQMREQARMMQLGSGDLEARLEIARLGSETAQTYATSIENQARLAEAQVKLLELGGTPIMQPPAAPLQ